MKGLNPSALSAVAGVTALVGAFKGLIGIGSNIVDMASHFETVRTELGTVLQDAEKGAELFEDLRKFSFETTFGVDELASASTQLLNAGKSAKTLQKDLKMLGDLAGGDKNKFAELTSIFSKVATQGKATSVQLQQINLRGIPITKTLKEMGVTGVASAEQLQEAFKKLTEEGGQFHNAMNNIIDTIEGKRGFITDTIKEIQVNLGEVTGLTDVYKSSLDTVYNVLNKFNNGLMAINDNPLVKAIIKGVLVAGISGLVGLLAGSLIPVLSTVFGLISSFMISNPITLILTAVATITGGFVTISKSLKNARDEALGISKIQKDTAKTLSDYGFDNAKVNKGDTQAEQYFKTMTDRYEKAREELIRMENDTLVDQLSDQQMIDYQKEIDNQKKIVELYAGMQKDAQTKLDTERGIQSSLDKQNEIIREQTDLYDKLTRTAGDVARELNPLYDKIRESEDVENQIKELITERDKVYRIFDSSNNQIDISLSAETKAKLNKDIEELQKKLNNLEIDIAVESQKDWQKTLQEVMGFSGEDVLKGATSSTSGAIDYYLNKANATNSKLMNFSDILGLDSKSLQTSLVNELKGVLKNLLLSDAYDGTEESLQKLKSTIEELESQIDNSINLGEYAGQQIAGKLTGDVGTFVSTLQQTGNVFMAIINTVIGALVNVLQTVDGFEETLSPLTKLFQKLRPLLEVLVEFVQEGEDIMDDVLTPIIGVLNAIGKVLKIINPIVQMIMRGLLTVFGLFNWITDLMEEWGLIQEENNSQKESETEMLKRLNEQYDNLLTSMKEQEEYYIQEKKRINSQTYIDEILGNRRVNDMILTPEGRFSTHPDDTIMAMKHPEDLLRGNGGVVMIKPIINNTMGDSVEATVESRDNNGMTELVVNISRKVAQDYANGNNGWESAYKLKQMRLSGRSVMG